jgi:hypothetical protein
MVRGSSRRFAAFILTTFLVFVATTAALGATAKDRKTLVLHGRITGSDGWPLVGAKVRARTVVPEVQKGRVSTGDAGQFTLQIPLGSPAELVGKPLTIRVGAESPGWRLAVVGGESEVGFDLRVVTGDDGIVRCEVRSNHSAVGAALLRLLTDDGEATETVSLSFLGTRGEPGSEPAPGNLALVDRVPLAGVHIAGQPAAETKSPAAIAPAPPPVATPAPPAATQPTVAEPKASGAPPAGAPTPTGQDTTRAKSTPAQSTTATKSAAPSRTSARSTSTATSSPRTAAKPAPPRSSSRSAAETDLKRRAMERDSARRAVEQEMVHAASGLGAISHPPAQDTAALVAQQEKLRRAALAESTRLVREEETRRAASADSVRHATEEAARIAASEEKARREAAKVSARLAAQAESHRRGAAQDSARRAAQAEIALRNQAQSPARLAAAAEAARRSVVEDSIRRAGDTAVQRAAQEQADRMTTADAVRRAGAERARREAALEAIRRENMAQANKRAGELRQQREPARPAAPRDTVTPATPVPPATTPPVRTVKDAIISINPKSDGEVRARSAPMVIRAIAPPALADGEPCSCRIEGTVEVSSDKPLPKRARVMISLVPNPAINTTVELFMGSPREFRLTGAPCGPQRLRLTNLGTMHFDIVSQEALNGFQCEPGKLHQFRIILKPRR